MDIVWKSPDQLVKEGYFVKIAAPMVRFSRLPFRILCHRWGCDVAYTPMITSKEFVSSEKYREKEIQSCKWDRPLIFQFAANNSYEIAQASQYVVGLCEGVDINCGCPQKWAIDEGFGCALLSKPELVEDMINQIKVKSNLPVSIKIRVQNDLRNTVELAKRAENIGVNWITVHGRTVNDRSSDAVNYDAVKLVKESVTIPIFGNGHCFNIDDVEIWKEKTNVDGIMSARGLLENPALFKGYSSVPNECINEFMNLVRIYKSFSFIEVQKLMNKMYFNERSKSERIKFNNLRNMDDIFQYFKDNGIYEEYDIINETPKDVMI